MKKKRKLILIVDDNAENRKVLGNLLVNNNYEVVVANDGFKALSLLKKLVPDLILLDVMMPGMNGYEVCEKIKTNILLKYVPIIFLTAKTESVDIVKGFRVGGVDYVGKPFNSEELMARVNTHVELHILRGLLPICSNCKSIRNDEGYWDNIENYIVENSDVEFTHTLCSKCTAELYRDEDWFKSVS